MSEYILTHTGEELDEAIGKVLDGYILPSGTLSITSNGEKNVKNYEKASVNVPIPDGYIKPSGTLSITSNGEKNVKNYEKASVNVPIKWGYTTVTGNGTGTLKVSGLPFRPLGFVMYPYRVVAWSTQNQIVACGDAGQRFNIMRTSQTNTISYGSLNGLDENGVSGSGSNWSFTASHTALVFRNGMTYRVLYWGL